MKAHKRNHQRPIPLQVIPSCDGCSACCMEQQSPPGLLAFVPGGVGSDGWAHKADGERYHSAPLEARQLIIDHVHHLKADPDGYGSADGPCVWLDQENRRCRFHEHRPQICRDFERGCDGCLAWRDEYL